MSHTTTASMEIVNTPAPEAIMPIILDTTYKGTEVKAHAGRIIGMESPHGWDVLDATEDMALVHCDKDADMATHGHLRGILVDLETDAIIATSFGHTPTAVASELVPVNGQISIKDTTGGNHVFSTEDIVVKRIFDGVVIRALWRKGKMERITHTRIDTSRSRWGSAKYFLTMYDEAGGPTAEQLFDTTKPFSSSVYDFMVVDQCLVVGTRQKINKPYVVFLSERTMELNRPAESVAPGIFNTQSLKSEIGGSVDESMIHSPKCLTIEEANRHLRYGYYNEFPVDDIRQMTGEAVIVYRVENGNVSDIVRVNSPAYDWRVMMRGNNSNVKNQFYCLLNAAYGDLDTPKKWNTFKEKFIILPLYDEKSLKSLYEQFGAILMIPSGETSPDDYSTRDDRIHLLWMNYVLSLPPHAQKEGLEILTQFKKDRADLIIWLQDLESTCQNIEAADVSDRVKGIISSARRISRERIVNGDNYSAKGAYMKLPLVIKSTIRNLIFKENGPSLYSRVREMKEFKNPKVVETVAEIPQ